MFSSFIFEVDFKLQSCTNGACSVCDVCDTLGLIGCLGISLNSRYLSFRKTRWSSSRNHVNDTSTISSDHDTSSAGNYHSMLGLTTMRKEILQLWLDVMTLYLAAWTGSGVATPMLNLTPVRSMLCTTDFQLLLMYVLCLRKLNLHFLIKAWAY